MEETSSSTTKKTSRVVLRLSWCPICGCRDYYCEDYEEFLTQAAASTRRKSSDWKECQVCKEAEDEKKKKSIDPDDDSSAGSHAEDTDSTCRICGGVRGEYSTGVTCSECTGAILQFSTTHPSAEVVLSPRLPPAALLVVPPPPASSQQQQHQQRPIVPTVVQTTATTIEETVVTSSSAPASAGIPSRDDDCKVSATIRTTRTCTTQQLPAAVHPLHHHPHNSSNSNNNGDEDHDDVDHGHTGVSPAVGGTSSRNKRTLLDSTSSSSCSAGGQGRNGVADDDAEDSMVITVRIRSPGKETRRRIEKALETGESLVVAFDLFSQKEQGEIIDLVSPSRAFASHSASTDNHDDEDLCVVTGVKSVHDTIEERRLKAERDGRIEFVSSSQSNPKRRKKKSS